MKTALVTGANGFVGSHLVDHLLMEGWRVRCLVRASSNRQWLPEDRVELTFGDVTEPSSLSSALRGTDTLFHVAGLIRGRNEAEYQRINADGTENVVRAATALSSPPTHLVLVSSLAAGGPSAPHRPRTENDPDAPQSAYGRSKLMGERALQQHTQGIPWTILRPPAVYGPRDQAFMILARASSRGWVFRLSGPEQQASIVHVRDLARGIVAASESPSARGNIYYLASPQSTSLRQMGRIMAQILDQRVHELHLPRALLPGLSHMSGWISRLSGRENRLHRDRVASMLAPGWVCSVTKALQDFGFEAQIDTTAGIRETLLWYVQEGWLADPRGALLKKPRRQNLG